MSEQVSSSDSMPVLAPSEIIRTDSVLVVDDDIISRSMLESTLRKWGFKVTTANDGLDAWNELQKQDAPSLIILDWMMPGLSGVELCRKIRARKTAHYPYILLLTARDTTSDLVEGVDAGADDYLTKPFHANELRARLKAGRRILTLQNELLHKEQQLSFQARHDSLTGLWNRGAILEFMEQEIDRARRDRTSVGVLLMDIDHFKRVNDTRGHQAGDAVLQHVARRLSQGIRSYDWVGRYGGEEFVVVVPNCSAENVAMCAERLREITSSAPMQALGADLDITLSLGAALYSGETSDTVADVLRRADTALYRAKQNGRNRVELDWLENGFLRDRADAMMNVPHPFKQQGPPI
ncbi:MAG: diguanylate cyclase [Candidatus Angelobacter sp.]